MPRIKNKNTEKGALLKTRRLELGLTLVEMGELLGITYQQVQKYETGKNKMSIDALEFFCEKTSTQLSYFLKSDDNISTDNRALRIFGIAKNLPESKKKSLLNFLEDFSS